MLASGTDVRPVAGRLGHASATTTLQTYSHLIGQADRDAAERLDALFSRAPG
jgi:integrase